jgi:hypothetical protein
MPGQIERVLDQAQPDAIIHCAAMTEVDRCEAYPEKPAVTNAVLPARWPALPGRACPCCTSLPMRSLMGTYGDYGRRSSDPN